jgi:hypothetical protein
MPKKSDKFQLRISNNQQQLNQVMSHMNTQKNISKQLE